MEPILQFGRKITQSNDPLQKISVDRIYQAISRPKDSFRKQIERLRMVQTLDPKEYGRLKKDLPYFVCGIFHPPARLKDNFAAIRHFVVDLDHFQEAEIPISDVELQLRTDERLLLMFRSPGGDGLKLMYRLSENCTDPGLYSLFYKAFIQDLARKYQLEQVIDTRTHDTTRACFMSVDPDAYYEPAAELVELHRYFDAGAPDAQREVEKAQRELEEKTPREEPTVKDPLSDEVLVRIKEQLDPNYKPRKKKKKPAYVPPKLEAIIPKIAARLEAMDMQLTSEKPIQYGKKLRIAAGPYWAEINVFFGKKGFSVVATTKTGSNSELAGMARQVIEEFLDNPDQV